jgi:hypothetical protein
MEALMTNAAQPSLLRRLMGASATVMPDVDPADMGTAIGLDFCLDEPPAETTGGPAVQVRPGAAPAGWLRRFSTL